MADDRRALNLAVVAMGLSAVVAALLAAISVAVMQQVGDESGGAWKPPVVGAAVLAFGVLSAWIVARIADRRQKPSKRA